MPDYNAIAADNLNGLMREIAEYTRMAEEITATLDGLKDTLKRYMDENGLDHIAGVGLFCGLLPGSPFPRCGGRLQHGCCPFPGI